MMDLPSLTFRAQLALARQFTTDQKEISLKRFLQRQRLTSLRFDEERTSHFPSGISRLHSILIGTLANVKGSPAYKEYARSSFPGGK